jgi:hypothetical protein
MGGKFLRGGPSRAGPRTRSDPQQRLVWYLSCYAILYLVAWWLMTHRIDRFWMPLLPVLSMLAGLGAAWSLSRLWRTVLTGTVLWGLLTSFLFLITTDRHDHRYLVDLNVLRVDEPDEPSGPSRVHAAHRYLNSAVPADECVLLVGDAQPFDLEMRVLYNTCFDQSMLERMLRGRTRDQRLAALRDQGISHVLVDWSEIDRYRSPGNYGFSDYVTRSLIRDELVDEQRLLRPVDLGVDPEWWQLFEVANEDALTQPVRGRGRRH